MTNLKIKPFKNSQTGNTADMVFDGNGLCTQYLEICAHGTVKAGQDHEESFWASWTPEGQAYSTDCVADCACLDDALSGLESELEAEGDTRPWHSETTGF
jgi:hypothetical protein